MNVPRELSTGGQKLVLGVLMVCSLLIWLDNTVLSITLETLASPVRGLGASPADLQWATGAYTLVFATLMITAGALGDNFGHRRVLAAGLVVFGGASVWAAYAGDPGQLIAARGAMGVGAALIMPAIFAILLWTFTGASRATAIAISSISTGVGMAAGPVLAGVLLSHFWWGSVFLVNVPVVVVALGGILLLVPNFRSPVVRRLDLAGIVLSISGLGALTYGLIRAGQVNAWSHLDVWMPIAIGTVVLAVFVLTELKAKTPSFDPRLLAARMFGGGNAAMGLLLFCIAAVTFYNAFFMQGALGYSPLKAGLANLPTALGAVIGAPLGARLVHLTSLRAVALPSIAVAAAGIGAMGMLGLQTHLTWVLLVLLVQGLAVGMVLAPVTGALISSLPLERSGAGSAVTNTARQTGSVLGIAVGGTILSLAYRAAIAPSLDAVPQTDRAAVQVSAEQARQVADRIGQPALIRAANAAFVHAMHVGVAWIGCVGLLATAVLAYALRPTAGDARRRGDGGTNETVGPGAHVGADGKP